MSSGHVAIATERPSRGVRRGAVALLEPTEQAFGETTQTEVPCSGTEREILDLLQRPARPPPGSSDLRHEPVSSHSLLEIQKSVFSLLDKGLVELVHKYGFDLGFRLASQETD